MDTVLQSALRKAAWRLVPLLTVAYVFNYLDRTCLGFAALTMNRDIGLTAAQFGLGAGIFFLGYSLFEIPSNLALYRFGARRWIARIMISWGMVSAATALVVGPNSFYAVRLLLGDRGGRLLSRRHLLPRRLVSRAVSHPDAGLVPPGHPGFLADRRPGLRGAAADGRRLGLAGWKWLFLAGQPALRGAGRPGPAVPRGPAPGAPAG